MKEKSIVFFNGSLTQGGAERVISILSKNLSEEGYKVRILLYYDREIFYKLNHGIEVLAVCKETGSGNILKNLFWIRGFFKKTDATIISFLDVFNMLALVATLFLKKKIIVADRSDPYHTPENVFLRSIRDLLYRLASGVVLQTNHSYGYFNKSTQKKSIVIYNPINLGEKLGLAINTPKHKEIVSVGRLMEVKNHEMLIRSFGKLHKQFPDYTLTIYGEGPNRGNLELLINRLSLNDSVFLPGATKDIFNSIKSAELFVFTSNYEGMPNALLEAMCLGLPVVSTKVAGATDLIKHEENGYLVEVGNEDELVSVMQYLLNNKEKRIEIAKKAINISEQLDVHKITNKWINFVESC